MTDLLKSFISPTSIFWVVVTIALSSIFGYNNSKLGRENDALKQDKEQLVKTLTTRDSAILILHKQLSKEDSTYRKHMADYDSLQTLRDENTNHPHLTADSLTKLWADRFSNHSH